MIGGSVAAVDRRRAGAPKLSVVVVVHDMARELPRTLRSLSPVQQVGIDAAHYEVVVIDNGSAVPVDQAVLDGFAGNLRHHRIDPAPASPVGAANHGIGMAGGDLVGLVIDGARLASPGLLHGALRARSLADRPLITAPAFHLGPVTHMRAAEVGYDQAAEDDLLARSGWDGDGYRLFEISTVAGSSGRGLFGPMGESSSLFATRAIWDELSGLDERFALPGGGLANHDLYRRACGLPGIELVVLLGEATFHQYHGGAATSRRFGWDDMHAEYHAITGARHEPPSNPALYVGAVPSAALSHIERSARQAMNRLARPNGNQTQAATIPQS